MGKVATVRGALYDAAFSADAIRKIEICNYEHNVKMFAARHAGTMIGPRAGLYFTATRLGF